jgi:hypothetical protein
VQKEAWNAMEPSSEAVLSNFALLPSITNPSCFPYRNAQNMYGFTIHNLPANVIDTAQSSKLQANSLIMCKVCGEEKIKLSDMRQHIGQHILRASRPQSGNEVDEHILDKLLIGDNSLGLDPCAFVDKTVQAVGASPSYRLGKEVAVLSSQHVPIATKHSSTRIINNLMQKSRRAPTFRSTAHCARLPLLVSRRQYGSSMGAFWMMQNKN